MMHCKQIEKQTAGEITEIELEGLSCNMAQMCRRKGICALSPFSYPGYDKDRSDEAGGRSAQTETPGSYYEVLRFKNSLGFQWMRAESYEDALQVARKFAEKGQPKFIRRVEILQLPD
ncbi:MAG TPA: hypothetical protein VJ417_08140 [Candidatus Glassbacteria bacterium]|nr:hypothetical protein [Candidatus Glassbacteria bacterium]